MAQTAVIRLDKSKPYSECRGERTPEDPHYKVHFFQAYQVNPKKKVLLPFDASGLLVEDDKKTEPWMGMAEGKPVEHQPLYNADMRALVERLMKKKAAPAEGEDGEGGGDDGDPTVVNLGGGSGDEVNLVAWLRGEAQYAPFALRAAVKERFARNCAKVPDIVIELVQEEKLVPEADVCPALAKYLLK